MVARCVYAGARVTYRARPLRHIRAPFATAQAHDHLVSHDCPWASNSTAGAALSKPPWECRYAGVRVRLGLMVIRQRMYFPTSTSSSTLTAKSTRRSLPARDPLPFPFHGQFRLGAEPNQPAFSPAARCRRYHETSGDQVTASVPPPEVVEKTKAPETTDRFMPDVAVRPSVARGKATARSIRACARWEFGALDDLGRAHLRREIAHAVMDFFERVHFIK